MTLWAAYLSHRHCGVQKMQALYQFTLDQCEMMLWGNLRPIILARIGNGIEINNTTGDAIMATKIFSDKKKSTWLYSCIWSKNLYLKRC